MAKKNLKDIHPLIPILCKAISVNNHFILNHLKRTNTGNHDFINDFQNGICEYLSQLKPQYCDYKWSKEEKAKRRKERDSIDIKGVSNNEICIIEIDATRIDQIAQKFVSRLCLWGLEEETKKPLLYIAILYKGSKCHNRKEDCEKYIRYCNKIIKQSKGKESSVICIYTDGNNIDVCDYNISSSFSISYNKSKNPNNNMSFSSNSMVEIAKYVIDWYVKIKKVKSIDDIVEIFGNTISKISIPSKNEVVETSIGKIYVSKDWREYGPRAYWNEFVNCCKKKHIIIKKKVIRYQPTSNKFIYV